MKWATLALLCASCVSTPTPLLEYLNRTHPKFDPHTNMVQQPREGPDYHTQIPRGTPVHPTVDSLDYALALFATDDAARHRRANAIVAAVLPLQVTDPRDDHYGVWPWFREEPVAQMAPPDRNWADFCGARLAQMLVHHADALTPAVRAAARTALGHAARAIRSRDVTPRYTNIAIMGAATTIAAGELLDDPRFVNYGQDKLRDVAALARRTGQLREYNSPIYNLVVIWECERVLHLVRNAAVREHAEFLRRVAWRTIAQSYHAPTGQWAGPHDRTYGDRLHRGQIETLSRRLGRDLPLHPSQVTSTRFPHWTVPALPCPPDLMAMFGTTGELRRTFSVGTDDTPALVGTTWKDDDACLGSINESCFWSQRRPVLGYWRTVEDPAVVFRVRGLKDGHDCAALALRNEQHGPRITSTFFTRSDRGDRHLNLDKPKDATYSIADLRIRFELRGRGVAVRQLAANSFALEAGQYRVRLNLTGGAFAGHPVQLATGTRTEDGEPRAFVDAILYRGDRRAFDFRKNPTLTTRATLHLERR